MRSKLIRVRHHPTVAALLAFAANRKSLTGVAELPTDLAVAAQGIPVNHGADSM